MSLATRPFRPEDLQWIYRVEKASFQDPWPRYFFMYMHRKSPDLFLVAMLDEQVVGYAVGELRKNLYGRPAELIEIGHILNVAVENGKRRKGVGTKLILELELRFRQKKATVAMLEVRESNTAARSFYKVLGYRETRRLAMYYGDEDAIIMTKDLFLKN